MREVGLGRAVAQHRADHIAGPAHLSLGFSRRDLRDGAEYRLGEAARGIEQGRFDEIPQRDIVQAAAGTFQLLGNLVPDPLTDAGERISINSGIGAALQKRLVNWPSA